jgi:hypothetical protein
VDEVDELTAHMNAEAQEPGSEAVAELRELERGRAPGTATDTFASGHESEEGEA